MGSTPLIFRFFISNSVPGSKHTTCAVASLCGWNAFPQQLASVSSELCTGCIRFGIGGGNAAAVAYTLSECSWFYLDDWNTSLYLWLSGSLLCVDRLWRVLAAHAYYALWRQDINKALYKSTFFTLLFHFIHALTLFIPYPTVVVVIEIAAMMSKNVKPSFDIVA